MSTSKSISEARKHFPDIIQGATDGEITEVTKRGEPVAVIISIAEYKRLTHEKGFFMDGVRQLQTEITSLDDSDEFQPERDAGQNRDFTW